jgi:cell division cycle protein 20 (cofactor of APC complex)
MDLDVSSYALTKEGGECGGDGDASKAVLKRALADTLLGGGECGAAAGAGGECGGRAHRVLAFHEKAPAAPEGHISNLKVLYSQNQAPARSSSSKGRASRHIPSVPERILDGPDLVDDYYLNLLDWSVGNVLAVALGQAVYLWNSATGSIQELMQTPGEDDFVCSVSWIKDGGAEYLAVGTNLAEVQLWDCSKLKQVRSMRGHTARVGALDWNAHVLTSGSRDTTIHHHDVRVREHHIATLASHEQEVCGVRWSPDGTTLASGSNDNALCIWDSAASASTSAGAPWAPRHKLLHHTAAVKALAWCPWQRGTLASGGGTNVRPLLVVVVVAAARCCCRCCCCCCCCRRCCLSMLRLLRRHCYRVVLLVLSS